MKTVKEKIEVMQAFEDGKQVEVTISGKSKWFNCGEPTWNWVASDYRVKPEPVEFWMNLYPDGDWGRHYESKNEAIAGSSKNCLRTIRVREVIEEPETNSIDERV